jgi:hypothetical protein
MVVGNGGAFDRMHSAERDLSALADPFGDIRQWRLARDR